jgi:hypothetical protein
MATITAIKSFTVQATVVTAPSNILDYPLFLSTQGELMSTVYKLDSFI